MSGALTETSILAGASNQGGFELKSARFEDGTDPRLTNTISANGDRRTFTISLWFKRGNLSLNNTRLYSSRTGGSDEFEIMFNSSDQLSIYFYNGSYSAYYLTTHVFRDSSAWYHLCYQYDSTQNTSTDRLKLWINGEQITDFETATYPSQNLETPVNKASAAVTIGDHGGGLGSYVWDGYVAEWYNIDGQSWPASHFAETNAGTGQWLPKDPADIKNAVTFGTNGFYLPFSNDALATDHIDEKVGYPVTVYADTHTDTAVKKFGTASAQFDGTGDYLSVPDSDAWNFGHSEYWTIEFWTYLNSSNDEVRFIGQYEAVDDFWRIEKRAHNDPNGCMNFRWTYANDNKFQLNGDALSWSDNTWYHIALVRNGNTIIMYRDGVSVLTSVGNWDLRHMNDVAGALTIGQQGSSAYLNGYMDEIRISNTARYTAAFSGSVPTAAFTADDNTLLLLHCDGSNGGTTFTDSSEQSNQYTSRHTLGTSGTPKSQRVSGKPFAATNAHIIGPKFGSSCIAFDGDEDYLSIADHADWAFGSGSFTVDFWANQIGSWEDDAFLWQQHADTNNFAGVRIRTSGDITLMARVGGSYTINLDFGSVTMPEDEWFHFALVRNTSGTNRFEVYINGTLQQTINNSTAWPDVAGPFIIGDDLYNSGKEFTGYMDEFRVSNTARYTADFTPATAAYSSDSNTKLLIHSNTTMGSTTFTDSGATTHTITASGNVKHIAPKMGTGMGVWYGSSSKISTPDHPAWSHFGDGQGNFTIEGWLYMNSSPANTGEQALFCQETSTSNMFMASINGTTRAVTVKMNNNSVISAPAGIAEITFDTWHHWALTGRNGRLTWYTDGKRKTSGNFNPGAGNMSGASFQVGHRVSDEGMDAYMDEFRVSTTSRYEDNFTPQTTPFKDDRETALLLHMDGGGGINPLTNLPTLPGQGVYFWDASVDAIFYDASGDPTQNSYIRSPGSNSQIEVADSTAWDFGTDNWTLEGWMNIEDFDSNASESSALLAAGASGGTYGDWFCGVWDAGGIPKFGYYSTTAGWNNGYTTVRLGKWYHFAVTRNGNDYHTWIDGYPDWWKSQSGAINSATGPFIGKRWSSSDWKYLLGNVDQLRISNSVRYNGLYTVPTGAFSNDSDTVLLMHMDGSDSGTTFTDSSTTGHTVTRGGNIVTATGQKKWGTASAHFNGGAGTNFLTITDHADFAFGTGDFTLEAWVYEKSAGSSQENAIFSKGPPGDTRRYWQLRINENNTLGRLRWNVNRPGFGNVVDIRADLGSNWSRDAWHHVAVVCKDGNHSLLYDGKAVGGDRAPGVNFDYSYESSGTRLLLSCDGSNNGTTFTDSSSYGHNVTAVGNVHTDTGEKKWGTASAQFDGTGDYLTVGHPYDWDVFRSETEAWTIDFWVKHTDHAGGETYLSQSEDSSNYWQLAHYHSGGLWFGVKTGGSWVIDSTSSPGTGYGGEITDTNWHHIALCKVGQEYGIYKDGTQVVFIDDTSTDTFSAPLAIGTSTWDGTNRDFDGYMDDIRIQNSNVFDASPNTGRTDTITVPTSAVSNDIIGDAVIAIGIPAYGVAPLGSGPTTYAYIDEIRFSKTARYNTTFSPPTEPFTDDADTELLVKSRYTEGGIGADHSGNYNSFATNAIGPGDSVIDNPFNNFATWNQLTKSSAGRNTFKEGNLGVDYNDVSGNSSAWFTASIAYPTSGKWYWEFADKASLDNSLANTTAWGVGWIPSEEPIMYDTDAGNLAWWYRLSNNTVGTAIPFNGSSSSENKHKPSLGGFFKVCYDADNGLAHFGGDLGWMTSSSVGVGTLDQNKEPSGSNYLFNNMHTAIKMDLLPAMYSINAGALKTDIVANFGQDSTFGNLITAEGYQDANKQGDFHFEVPTGYKALCTANLPAPPITDPTAHFGTALYTGTGSELSISSLSFQPDLVWIKTRGLSYHNRIFNIVGGVTKELYTNVTNAEVTDAQSLKSFDNDGFTLGTSGGVNPSSNSSMVSWNWKAGGATSANTDGTINSNVSVNAAAGISLVGYTGQTSAGTVGHGLGVKPECIWAKDRTNSNNWAVYHHGLATDPETDFLRTPNTAAVSDDNTIWNDAAPTTSVFSVGTGGETSYSGAQFAWCMVSIEGYSKFGYFAGNNNANGAFAYCGFTPELVIIRRYDASHQWLMYDATRDIGNPTQYLLYPSLDSAGGVSTSKEIDIVSNGFKIRDNYDAMNQGNMIFMAWAKTPFKYSNAR